MTSEQAYVFVDGLEAQPVICAVVTLDPTRRYGEFRYGKSYLARPDAFPLDPLNLPLSEQLYSTNAGKGVGAAGHLQTVLSPVTSIDITVSQIPASDYCC